MSFAFLGLTQGVAKEAAKNHVITIENMTFTPSTVQIQSGDQLTFKNADLVPHTATSKQGQAFDSGIIKPGDSWTVTPHGNATIEFACTFHPTMTGKVTFVTRP